MAAPAMHNWETAMEEEAMEGENENEYEEGKEEEDDGMEGGEEGKGGKGQRKKKKQVRRACVNCKRAHACCSDDRPCRRCKDLGIESTCFDVEPKKRGRKRKRRPEENMVAIQAMAGAEKRPRVDSTPFSLGGSSFASSSFTHPGFPVAGGEMSAAEELAKLRSENAWLRGLLAWTATNDGDGVPPALKGIDVRSVLEGAGVGLLMTTRGGGVVGWNKCLQEKLGFCAEDLRSGRVRSWLDMVHPQQWLEALREGIKCFSTRKDSWSLPSLSCVKRDGSVVPALCHTVVVRDPSNHVPLYSITHFFF